MVRVGLKFFSSKVSTDELLSINPISTTGGAKHIQYANQSTLVIGTSSAPDGLAYGKTLLSTLVPEDVTGIYRHNAQNMGDISIGRRLLVQQEQRLSKMC
jgi:hypothetical protein